MDIILKIILFLDAPALNREVTLEGIILGRGRYQLTAKEEIQDRHKITFWSRANNVNLLSLTGNLRVNSIDDAGNQMMTFVSKLGYTETQMKKLLELGFDVDEEDKTTQSN